jgi:hypothetical protein
MQRLPLYLLVVLVGLIAFSWSATAARQSAASDDGYALALFPIKVIAHWGEGYVYKTEILAVEGIANTVAEDPQLGLAYTYTTDGNPGDAQLLEDALAGRDVDVWRQTSLMSNYSPDWHRVKSFGSRIKADLAVLIRIREDAGSHVVIYLYDYRAGKIYSKTNKGVYYGSMSAGVQKILEALMQDFYDNQ